MTDKPQMVINPQYMQRCFTLAKNGLGKVAPNPMVGCVIVHNNQIIGESFHQKYGEAHAEVNAINSVASDRKHLLKEATLYVSLEPCSFFGKTPPCADLIIKYQIPKVVIAMQDPFAKVNGIGIQRLKDTGIEVEVGILEDEAKKLIKRFITFHQKKRPYIILKWAQTNNGFMAKPNQQAWITNALSKKLSHKWRAEEAAILVGTSTVKIDNPQLNVRQWFGKNPTIVTYDWQNDMPANTNIFKPESNCIVFNFKHNNVLPKHVKQIQITENENIAQAMMTALHQNSIQSVIIEGGRKTLDMFISTNLWDEARILSGTQNWTEGIEAPKIGLTPNKNFYLDGDKVEIFINV